MEEVRRGRDAVRRDRIVWWRVWERLSGIVNAICVVMTVCLYVVCCSHSGHALTFDQFLALAERIWKWAMKGWH
jgi:hypothetical protein